MSDVLRRLTAELVKLRSRVSALERREMPTVAPVNPSMWEQILGYLATNYSSNPIDAKLSINGFTVLIYFGSKAGATWGTATNARHTVATGKTLAVLQVFSTPNITQAEINWCRVRLHNITDDVTVVDYPQFINPPHILWGLSAVNFPSVAAGKTVGLELWSGDAVSRRMGGMAICREV
jgi:hypothetical protein